MFPASADPLRDEVTKPKRWWIRALHSGGHPSTRVSLAVILYVFGAAVTWTALTPVGAAPDEPAHIAYAAGVVRGDLGELVPGSGDSPRRLVMVTAPEWVNSFTVPARSVDEFRYPCFATIVSREANCAPELTGSTALAEIPTTVGRYPPPYHWIVGLPTLVLAGNPAVYAMRLISAALATGMVAMGLAIASPARRTWLALGTAVAFTPTAAHLAGSVNPSGLEISAALALGVGLMGVVASDPPRRNMAGLLVALSFALAWSRPLGYLTFVAVILASWLINRAELRAWLRDTATRTIVVVGASAAAVSAILYRVLAGLPARAASAADPTTGSTLFGTVGLDSALDEVENYLINWSLDLVGRFGWVDHSPPGSVLFGWVLLTIVLVLFVFIGSTRRDRLALTILGIGALVITPLVAITTTIHSNAYEARYHLPLAVLIIVGLAKVSSGLPESDERRFTWSLLRWGAVLVPIAMLVSVAASLHRYSLGAEAQLVDLSHLLFEFKEWLPPPGALAVGTLGAATILTAPILLHRSTRQRAGAVAAQTGSTHPTGNRDR